MLRPTYRPKEYFLLVAILLLSGGWIVVVRMGNDILLALVAVYVIYKLVSLGRLPVSISPSYVVLFVMTVFASFFQDGYFDEKEVAIVIKMLLAFACCIYFWASRIDFLRLYVELMYYVCLFSLFLLIFIYAAPFLLVSVDGEYLTLFGVSFVRVSDQIRFGWFRNQSFFWEAGVFGVMISLAYVLNELTLNERRIRRVLFVGALSTRSMGALAILVPTAFYFYLAGRSRILGYTLLAIAIAVVSVFVFYPGAIESAALLLFGRSFSDDASLVVRVNDLFLGFKAAEDGLVFGRPSGDFDAYNDLLLEEHGYSKGDEGGITNSLVTLVYKFGVPVAISYCYCLYSFSKSVSARAFVLLFLVLVGLLMIEPLAFSVFWFMVLIWRPRYSKGGSVESKMSDQAYVR